MTKLDARIVLALLVGLNALLLLDGGIYTTVSLILFVCLVLFALWDVLVSNLKYIGILVCVLVIFYGIETFPNFVSGEVLSRAVTWLLVGIATIVLVFSLNAYEGMTGLRYYRVPIPITIAVAVGFRFLGELMESVRIAERARKRRGWTIGKSIRQHGISGTVSRLVAPIIVNALRRVDAIVKAVAIQDLEGRARMAKNRGLGLLDVVLIGGLSSGIILAVLGR